jgi:hypothetical protein
MTCANMTAGRPGARRAVTLVEVLVGILIMAGVVGSIVSFVNAQARSVQREKSEVAAIEKAARVADTILWAMPFESVLSPVPGDRRLAGEETIEGTRLSWVTEVIPVESVTFTNNLAAYHAPHMSGEPGCPPLEPASEDSFEFVLPSPAGAPVLLDVKLTVRWMVPADGSFSADRELILFIRRANL